ncbi:MAG TPA: cellulase family glycosylhydrolase [Baekduia sp.]|nr:cellulase family glycosylhydrolase [Baekduia sp.]
MTSLIRTGLIASVVALCCTASASAAPSSRGVNIIGIGQNPSTAAISSELSKAKLAGANVVRTQIFWSALEPSATGGVDQTTLAALDALVAGANARGIKVLPIVDSAPCWASDAPPEIKGDCSTPGQIAGAAGYGPSDPARYGAITAMIAARYGAKLAGIEIWNEPDQANELHLKGPNKVARYAAILKAAYPAIKAVSPTTKVLGGTFVGGNGKFLQALYDAGIKGYYDILSVHFYDETLYSLRETRKVMKANGDTKPVWLGEFGYSSCYPQHKSQGGLPCVSRRIQGRRIADVFRGLRRAPYVQGAIVYQLSDSQNYDMGLFDRNGKKKPSFAPVSSIFKHKKIPKPRKVSLKLRRAGSKVVATGSGPGGDFYEIRVWQSGQLRYLGIVKLSRNLTFKTALPKALGTSGLTVKATYLSGGSATRRI